MIATHAPDRAARPIWLTTLADLGLLLVGFFVFVQATQNLDKRALANGFREGFGAAPAPAAPDPMPVAAAAMLNFAPGSATLPGAPDGLVAWARAATGDPRVTLRIAGSVDGSAADVDAATGSGAVLAADRARAVAAALARARVAPGRMTIVNAPDRPGQGRRQVLVTLGFAGDPS
ncbi:flagellar motor protein MotB [Hephaestia sp. GCM10023244]|uniref:flagellar motor protein MotB n=1 Tax=unclassified Hephaestia TaxID=2631281 RepID=UPI002076FFB5|nr:flagellar motor protein MotB [Hephaestia sp. MAHUQ-44]MCM8731249.1 flagellar motor protein MotB [Hephaestia sp. MAHUQ-44]